MLIIILKVLNEIDDSIFNGLRLDLATIHMFHNIDRAATLINGEVYEYGRKDQADD